MNPSRPSLVDAAVQHLASCAPADRPLVLLMSVGAGAGSSELASRLRAALAQRMRVEFSAVRTVPGAPVPAGPDGAHVHASATEVLPRPDRVVRVNAEGETASIGVRLPGRDPLGPPTAGWEWAETRP